MKAEQLVDDIMVFINVCGELHDLIEEIQEGTEMKKKIHIGSYYTVSITL